jgi:hypothetical protein
VAAKIMQLNISDYGTRNLQARVLSNLLYIILASQPLNSKAMETIIDSIGEVISGEAGEIEDHIY